MLIYRQRNSIDKFEYSETKSERKYSGLFNLQPESIDFKKRYSIETFIFSEGIKGKAYIGKIQP